MSTRPRRPATPPAAHRFAQPRASTPTPHSQSSPLFPGSPFQPLPPPTGKPPFRLDIEAILPGASRAMRQAGGMVLHMVGDTGGVKDPNPQHLVAAGLVADAEIASAHGKPTFLYHLGDVIYFDGQAQEYFPQFYDPYGQYDLPILGIPGNHDGDVFDDGTRTNPLPSLATFVRNFCAPSPGVKSPDAGEAVRTAMIQPNVYFTLTTPFATFIGLYTNVPEGGVVEPEQEAWFTQELADAPADRPTIVALHHPIHSLDVYHSGSKPMAALLERAAAKAKRRPHLVCSGHVHDYQRFTVVDPGGKGVTPYVVAGQGGYHNLHKVATVDGQRIVAPFEAPDDPGVTLESYSDDRFGFLRLEISAHSILLSTYTVPLPTDNWEQPPRLIDRMEYDWIDRHIVRPQSVAPRGAKTIRPSADRSG